MANGALVLVPTDSAIGVLTFKCAKCHSTCTIDGKFTCEHTCFHYGRRAFVVDKTPHTLAYKCAECMAEYCRPAGKFNCIDSCLYSACPKCPACDLPPMYPSSCCSSQHRANTFKWFEKYYAFCIEWLRKPYAAVPELERRTSLSTFLGHLVDFGFIASCIPVCSGNGLVVIWIVKIDNTLLFTWEHLAKQLHQLLRRALLEYLN